MTVFAAALAACNLDYGQAATLLGINRGTVQKKASGSMPITAADVEVLRKRYDRIQSGTEDEDADIRAAAAAFRLLRGEDKIEPGKIGRPRGAKNKTKKPPTPPWPPHPYSATPCIPLATLYTDPVLKKSAEAIDDFLRDITTDIPED